MSFLKGVLSVVLCIIIGNAAVVYIPGVQIDPMLIYQLQATCNILQADLIATYGKSSENDINYYIKTYAVNYFLQQLSKNPNISAYNNIISGSNNTVLGSHSIIVGSNNYVNGSNNYIFSQDFNTSLVGGSTSNSLVLDNWLINLLMLNPTNFFSYLQAPHSYIYNW